MGKLEGKEVDKRLALIIITDTETAKDINYIPTTWRVVKPSYVELVSKEEPFFYEGALVGDPHPRTYGQ